MSNRKPARARALAVGGFTAMLALSACGTRMGHSEIVDAQRGFGVGAAGSGQQQLATGGGANGVLPAGATADTAAGGTLIGGGSTGGTGAVTGGGGTTGGGTTGGGTTGGGTTGGGGHTSTGGGTTRTGGGTTGGGTGGSSGTAEAPCTAQGAPIVIGQDGVWSGLVGQTTGNIRLGMSVWQKWVNARGGIQCHPVQLYQTDNGSDPAKTSANINDLVKNKHVTALVGGDWPLVMAPARAAIDQARIPAVGGDLTDLGWWEDRNFFPSGGYQMMAIGGPIVQAASDTGAKKAGLLYCVEAAICGSIHQNFASLASAAHVQVLNQQSISLTQPDFTAECQNSKAKGIDLLFLAMDASSLQRASRSCASVGYKPHLVTAAIAAGAVALADPNLRAAGLYIGTNEVPYIATGSPALDTFHSAFKQFTGRDALDQASLKGWASGMLFKAAIDALGPAARKGPITSDMVFQGLSLLKNETLGGLIPPTTYPKGNTTPAVRCYGSIKVDTHGVTAPRGSKFSCM